MSELVQKYLNKSRALAEAGYKSYDICEHCGQDCREKDNTCGKCGAPMKPLLGTVFGVPIEPDDYQEVENYLNNMQYIGTAIQMP